MKLRRLLLSLAVLVFAGSVVAGGTGAFFYDEETSSNNVFAAGSIDLTVDSVAHYNGMICFDSGASLSDGYLWHPENTVVWNDTASPTPQYEVASGVATLGDLEDAIDIFNDANPGFAIKAGDSCVGTWDLRNLNDAEMPATTFFSFDDIKPGDHGENTISLHVENNDAWACAVIDNMHDEEIGDLTEPEAEVDFTPGEGELSEEIHFFAWADDGDNVWENGEQVLFSNEEGPASDVIDGVAYPLYTPGTGNVPMSANATEYIGLYWCYGDVTVDVGGNTLSCDGSTVTNLTQLDRLRADIGFYVEQASNNPDFTCPQPEESEQTLLLENGDQTTDPWTPKTGDGISGLLTWAGDGTTFDYSVNAEGLPATTAYTLIYYRDPYAAGNSSVIGTGMTNGSGDLVFAGDVDLGFDIPEVGDNNYPGGGKIWLIPSANYNTVTDTVTPWAPDDTWLFEGNVLINYDDTDA